ncbi:MAG: 50S ribosomal protein L21, partial [Gemmataceae bacterium]|nr:50S ribosomal protein L21 [Gemmataceae bacterium]
PGGILRLDERPAEVGQKLELTRVLLLRDETGAVIGRPWVAGAKVVVEVLEQERVKTMTQKFRRRKASKRLKGHTQRYWRVKVVEIIKPDGSSVGTAAAPAATASSPSEQPAAS